MRRDVNRHRGDDPAFRLVALHALRRGVVGAPGQEALAVGSGRRQSPDASLIAPFLKPPEIPPLLIDTKPFFLGTLPRVSTVEPADSDRPCGRCAVFRARISYNAHQSVVVAEPTTGTEHHETTGMVRFAVSSA